MSALGVMTIFVRSFHPGEIISIVTSVMSVFERVVGAVKFIIGGNRTVLLLLFHTLSYAVTVISCSSSSGSRLSGNGLVAGFIIVVVVSTQGAPLSAMYSTV